MQPISIGCGDSNKSLGASFTASVAIFASTLGVATAVAGFGAVAVVLMFRLRTAARRHAG